MSAKTSAEVVIDGKVYTLSGYEGTEYLQKVAGYINDKIAEFDSLEDYRHFPLNMKATLVQLNIADDYFKAKSQVEKLERDLELKEKEIYDNWWFLFYVGCVAVLFIAYLTWLFFRTQIQKTLRMQRMELEWTKRQLQMGNETIMTIAQAVDAKDENTSQHSVRVSEYSVMIARRLGYDEEACEQLRRTAVLHDIGKIGIPDRILNKPDKLTDEEYDIMKSHVDRGAEILKNFTLIDRVEEGVLYHHERYDGKGYCTGKAGTDIPQVARIIGVADSFDAMSSDRCYRKALSQEAIAQELNKGSGTQFDPKVVPVMLQMMREGVAPVTLPSVDPPVENG